MFLAGSDGKLPLDSARALISGGFNHVVVVGGTAVVSDDGWGVYQAAAIMGGGGYDDVTRLAGETMYDHPPPEVAESAVSMVICSWDGAALSDGPLFHTTLLPEASCREKKAPSYLLSTKDTWRRWTPSPRSMQTLRYRLLSFSAEMRS